MASGTAKNWLEGCGGAFTRVDGEPCALVVVNRLGPSLPLLTQTRTLRRCELAACKALGMELRAAHRADGTYEALIDTSVTASL